MPLSRETSLAPQLAPPGAGLPQPELTIAGLQFTWFRSVGGRERFTALLHQERTRVAQLLESCPEGAGATRVLIQRLPGMEDSSRYWSVWMTLEHLRLVQEAVASIISSLGIGVVPQRAVSTASVKPKSEADARAVTGFHQSCDVVLDRAAQVTHLKTSARYAHPWFGPLNALGWYAMVPFHLKLHRVQIEKILAGLK